ADVWNVSNVGVVRAGRLGLEWTLGSEHGISPVCGDARPVVWRERGTTAGDLSEHRELLDKQSRVCVGTKARGGNSRRIEDGDSESLPKDIQKSRRIRGSTETAYRLVASVWRL